MAIKFTVNRQRRGAQVVTRLATMILALTGLDAFGQTAVPPPPAPPPPRGYPVHPVRAIGHPGDWASDNDYPTDALRKHETGRAGFMLTIDSTGKPSNCQITQSTNHADLDQITCELMMRRARFTPATDADFKPTSGTWRSWVNWAIPQEFDPVPGSGSKRVVAFDVLADGSVTNCVATSEGGLPADIFDLDICMQRKNFTPPRDLAGKPTKKHVVVQLSVTTTDTP